MYLPLWCIGFDHCSLFQLTNVQLKVLRPSGPNYGTGKMLNGYLMFSVNNIVQNVKLNELWGKNLAPLHFVISKS